MLVSGVFWAKSVYQREQMLPYDANNNMRKYFFRLIFFTVLKNVL